MYHIHAGCEMPSIVTTVFHSSDSCGARLLASFRRKYSSQLSGSPSPSASSPVYSQASATCPSQSFRQVFAKAPPIGTRSVVPMNSLLALKSDFM